MSATLKRIMRAPERTPANATDGEMIEESIAGNERSRFKRTEGFRLQRRDGGKGKDRKLESQLETHVVQTRQDLAFLSLT